MKIEPLTLASLAPIQIPTKRTELNGHILRRGDGYCGMQRGTPSSNSPSQKFQSTGVALILVPHWMFQSLGYVLENIKIHHKTRQHLSLWMSWSGWCYFDYGHSHYQRLRLANGTISSSLPFAKVKIFYSHIYSYKTPL